MSDYLPEYTTTDKPQVMDADTESYDNFADTKNDIQYPGLDILKFIFALFVVTIHMPFVTETDSMAWQTVYFIFGKYLARLAVPFFFAASGFLLFRNTDFSKFDSGNSIRSLKKTACIFGIWTMLQFVFLHQHMWFMTALMGGTIGASIICSRKIPLWSKALIAFLLYAIGLAGTSYYNLLQYILSEDALFYKVASAMGMRNGIFMGTPVMMVGALLASKRIKISKLLASIILLISVAALLIEILFVKSIGGHHRVEMYLSYIPAVFCLVYLATNIDIKPHSFYRRLRIASAVMFFSNSFVITPVKKISEYISSRYHYTISAQAAYVVAMILIITVGFSVEYLSRKEKFKHLKMLFS